MNAVLVSQPANPPPAPTRQTGEAVQTWGWSLLALFIALLVGAMIVVIAKRMAFGARGVGSKQVKRRATDTRSAWEESGRRMGTPDSELKEEP